MHVVIDDLQLMLTVVDRRSTLISGPSLFSTPNLRISICLPSHSKEQSKTLKSISKQKTYLKESSKNAILANPSKNRRKLIAKYENRFMRKEQDILGKERNIGLGKSIILIEENHLSGLQSCDRAVKETAR